MNAEEGAFSITFRGTGIHDPRMRSSSEIHLISPWYPQSGVPFFIQYNKIFAGRSVQKHKRHFKCGFAW